MGLFLLDGKAVIVGVSDFVAVKLGISVSVGGIVVLIGEIEVLIAEQDTIVTVTKNDKQIDFFIG